MYGDTLIEITWRPRSAPLAPIGAAARGAAATRLAHRLLREPVDVLSQLKGVGGPGILVILGAEGLLPWVDMVVYLGRDRECPSVLLPTTFEPSVPLSLLERSLTARFASMVPCALLLDPHSIIPVTAARPLARKTLLKWLEADL
jgi:hypothetical protein